MPTIRIVELPAERYYTDRGSKDRLKPVAQQVFERTERHYAPVLQVHEAESRPGADMDLDRAAVEPGAVLLVAGRFGQQRGFVGIWQKSQGLSVFAGPLPLSTDLLYGSGREIEVTDACFESVGDDHPAVLEFSNPHDATKWFGKSARGFQSGLCEGWLPRRQE